MFKRLTCLLLLLVLPTVLFAQIETKTIDYNSEGNALQGYLAYPTDSSTLKPGILIVHDWMGLKEFTKDKAEKLAAEGYVSFAVDVYGPGNLPANSEQAAKLSSYYKSNRDIMRQRIKAAYDILLQQPGVDAKKIVVIGYCFGGTVALELARSGADLAGTVTFHGGLDNPNPQDAKNIHGKVLILHGADDPHVPPKEVAAFKDEMKKAGIAMTFIAYPGAVHAFTNPQAGDDPSKGVAYNAQADKESWMEFEKFLKETVGQ